MITEFNREQFYDDENHKGPWRREMRDSIDQPRLWRAIYPHDHRKSGQFLHPDDSTLLSKGSEVPLTRRGQPR